MNDHSRGVRRRCTGTTQYGNPCRQLVGVGKADCGRHPRGAAVATAAATPMTGASVAMADPFAAPSDPGNRIDEFGERVEDVIAASWVNDWLQRATLDALGPLGVDGNPTDFTLSVDFDRAWNGRQQLAEFLAANDSMTNMLERDGYERADNDFVMVNGTWQGLHQAGMLLQQARYKSPTDPIGRSQRAAAAIEIRAFLGRELARRHAPHRERYARDPDGYAAAAVDELHDGLDAGTSDLAEVFRHHMDTTSDTTWSRQGDPVGGYAQIPYSQATFAELAQSGRIGD